MSAWVCTRRHVAAVAKFGFAGLSAVAVADDLMAENVRSVRHRYDDGEAATEAPFTLAEILAAPVLSPTAALKAIHCLDYQSCECDDYEQRRAAKLLAQLKASALTRGARRESAAYERALWGIPEVQP